MTSQAIPRPMTVQLHLQITTFFVAPKDLLQVVSSHALPLHLAFYSHRRSHCRLTALILTRKLLLKSKVPIQFLKWKWILSPQHRIRSGTAQPHRQPLPAKLSFPRRCSLQGARLWRQTVSRTLPDPFVPLPRSQAPSMIGLEQSRCRGVYRRSALQSHLTLTPRLVQSAREAHLPGFIKLYVSTIDRLDRHV